MKTDLWQPGVEGIYFDLPAETYHKAPGVSNSVLKEMDPPANHKAAKPKKVTPDMLLGTLIHQAILEPQKPMDVVMKPEGMSFSTTEGKKWKAAHEGQTILSPDDYWAIGGCAKSVLSHPKCAELFSEGDYNHPADYEGAAYFKERDFELLQQVHSESIDMLSKIKIKYHGGYLIFYRKAMQEQQVHFDDKLFKNIASFPVLISSI
jgi:hypothetical protein